MYKYKYIINLTQVVKYQGISISNLKQTNLEYKQ